MSSALLLGLTAGVRHWLDRWAPLADWLVAFGTILLAFATFALAKRATEEAKAVTEDSRQVAEQVRLQREQMEQGARAYVFPSTPRGWAAGAAEWQDRRLTVLPLKNGGPGLALNAEGRVYWPTGGGGWLDVTIYGGSIAPSDSVEARLSRNADWGWPGAIGYVKYSDLNGDQWLTAFKYSLGEGGQLACEHEAPEQITDEGVIGQRYPPRE